MRANTLLLCVEEKSGKVVGMVTLMQSIQPYGNFATIEDVATHPDHQRKGLSEALVKIAIDTAREAGYDTIKLTSKPKRAPARSLYEKLGFKSDGETEKFKLPLK
jgi:ribosomal protein S18 acetylase RimI-like enzyme